jgi:hypothetical protein
MLRVSAFLTLVLFALSVCQFALVPAMAAFGPNDRMAPAGGIIAAASATMDTTEIATTDTLCDYAGAMAASTGGKPCATDCPVPLPEIAGICGHPAPVLRHSAVQLPPSAKADIPNRPPRR